MFLFPFSITISHSPFPISRSQFSMFYFSFSIPHSPFPIPRFPLLISSFSRHHTRIIACSRRQVARGKRDCRTLVAAEWRMEEVRSGWKNVEFWIKLYEHINELLPNLQR